MAKVSPIDDNIKNVYQYASNAALKKGQSYINTAGIFDGVQRLFALKPEFKEISAKVKEILGKYSINSEIFNEAYADIFPVGEELPRTVETEIEDDAMNVLDALKVKAQTERRVQTAEDLLLQLFTNKAYKLFLVFSRVSDKMKEAYDAAVEAQVSEAELPPTAFDVNLFYADMRKLLARTTVKEIQSLETDEMQKYLTNLNKYVASRSDLKLVGMEREILGLEVALAGRTKKSAVLVGKPGTGKTSLVYELANRINNNDESLPEMLRGTIIYELHMDAIVAGSQFRGQFEQRLKVILDAVAKLKNVILFIDEFHTIVKAGGSGSESGGDTTGANIMKPYLSRGDIWVVGATTNDEFNEYVEKDKAISRRFKKVLIHEPSKEETIEIMRGVLPINCDYFDKEMREELLEKIYTLSTQYNMHTANPDKSLTMLESAFAYAKVCKAENREVVLDDMMKAIALEYDINVSDTKSDDTRKFAKSFLLGQDEPIENICKYLDMIELNVVDPEKPRCSLLFAGPTGVGKTEMAKIIAKHFTGSERNLVTVEGSSLQSETGVSTLFGADAGYVGYKQTSDFLSQVKQNPNCVVLFDEIEKANKAVFKALLNILDEGYAKDKGGNKISFRNAIIIFTTNLGYGKSNHTGGGIMGKTFSGQSAVNEINKFFSPEFIGRLDEVITFNRLTSDISDKLIERYRAKYAKLSGFENIKFTKADIEKIKTDADIENLGARNLDHLVKVAFSKKVIAARAKSNK